MEPQTREEGAAGPEAEVAASRSDQAPNAEELERIAAALIQQWKTTGERPDHPGQESEPSPLVTTAPEERASLVRRLLAMRTQSSRYAMRRELARGGMGRVIEAFDSLLNRYVALKVPDRDGVGTALAPDASLSARDARFLEEAQIGAQLDHPGIVPVHELGLDSNGRPYFAMRYVRGRTLGEVFRCVWEGREEWTQTRVLGVLQRVCETLAYAHAKGVVHRDLKPDNVQVGRYGEVYVIDWGLARIDPSIRGCVEAPAAQRLSTPSLSVFSDRQRGSDGKSDGSSGTVDGVAHGTPSYMPPEQANGDLANIGPASDVYAIGAMLYELLAEHPPYQPPGAEASGQAIVERVRSGPPAPLPADLPVELVCVVEKAMARRVVDRYADTLALSRDLQAFLEDRVVRAHRVGPLAEFSKWTRRNRRPAAAVGTSLMLAVGALGLSTSRLASSNGVLADSVQLARTTANQEHAEKIEIARARDLAEQQRASLAEALAKLETTTSALASTNGALVTANRDLSAERDRVLRLSDQLAVSELRSAAVKQWPAWPDRLSAIDELRQRCTEVVGRLPVHRARLEALRRSGVSRRERLPAEEARRHPLYPDWTSARDRLDAAARSWAATDRRALSAGQREARRADKARLRADLERLDRLVFERDRWSFRESELQWEHDLLLSLVDSLATLEEDLLPDLERRAHDAATLTDRAYRAHRAAWTEAREAIRSSSLYGGLDLPYQPGLVPLTRNGSGLFEFVDIQTGAIPELAGALPQLRHDSGVVYVLIPGSRFTPGGHADDAHELRSAGYRIGPWTDELGASEVELDPFFLSKYELTQAQWERMSHGQEPSVFASGSYPLHLRPGRGKDAARDALELHPAENVSWHEATSVLARSGAALPTEAQWEYACRAGASKLWWTDQTAYLRAMIKPLAGKMNLADAIAGARGPDKWIVETVLAFDGYVYHAPVDSREANGFRLYHMSGNVAEWCRDGYVGYEQPARSGDGLRTTDLAPRQRVLRGGSFQSTADEVRIGYRAAAAPEDHRPDIGVRPARAILPLR